MYFNDSINGRTDVILIDKMYNRLVTLEQVYVNYDILYDTLIKHEIDLVDFGELVEQNKMYQSMYLL